MSRAIQRQHEYTAISQSLQYGPGPRNEWQESVSAMRGRYCARQQAQRLLFPGCSEEFYIRSRPGHARLRVFERDKGICSKCGKNVFAGTGRRPSSNGTGDLWQADHIVAVVEGGGECSLENLRTLCTACHKAETADLAARLANAKRLAHAERLARQPVLEFVTA